MNIFENIKRITKPYGDDEYEDDYEDEELEDYEEQPARNNEQTTRRNEYSGITKPDNRFNGSVVSMGAPKANKAEMVLTRPNSFSEATKAADDLRNKKAVIVNLEQTDKAVSRRIRDFLAGCAYALDGKVYQVANDTFLYSPFSMDVVGDLDGTSGDAE